MDLVLSDVVMPVMGGRELAHRMAGAYPAIPIIWVSGYPRDAAMGADASLEQPFLQKPVRSDILLDAVRRALAPQASG